MFGLFAFIITGLHRFGLIEIEPPEFIRNIFFKDEDGGAQTGGDDGSIYDFLRDGADFENNGGGFVFGITADNIGDIISRIKLPDNLYLEITANYYGGISRTEEMHLWKKGGKYKYSLAVDSNIIESYINDSVNELIENHITGSILKRPVPESFSFDNIPHIQNINYYFSLLERLESGEIINVEEFRNPDSNIAEIKYFIPLLNQHEIIEISLDTGIAVRIRSYAGENQELYYESVTTVRESYYDGDIPPAGTTINDSLFVID
jgi:hypothetical protein